MKDSNRRPLASRQTGWAHSITTWLARTNITPNEISVGSMLFAAIAGVCFALSGSHDGASRIAVLLVAVLCCQLRLLCNLFDGMVAVEAGKHAKDGAAWNEFPDRMADLFIFVGCGVGAGEPALGWAAASFAILTAYIRELGVANQMPADFSGPMAKQHRMAVITFAGLLSVFLPSIMAVNTLSVSLWIVAAGAALTAALRTRNLIQFLNRD